MGTGNERGLVRHALVSNLAYRGRAFEGEIDLCLACYARLDLAWLARFHVPRVWTRRGMVYTARTWTDYAGLNNEGRAILLEVKSMAKEHTWKPDREHQLTMLQTANRCGALGLYVIRVGIDICYLWKPPMNYRFGDKVTWADCARLDRQWGECPWPWLEKIKELGW